MDWKQWTRRAQKLTSHARPVRFLASRLLWQTGVSHLFTVELPDGHRLRFYPSSISAAFWVEASARNEDAEFLRLVLRAGDTYVDCGANVGHLAILARGLTGAEGSVTAIEANPRIFQYCVGNLRLNQYTDVLALNVALGETRGTIRIGDRRDDDQGRVGDTGLLVPMRPLDEVLGATSITLLKLDVEGYELHVLRGSRRVLANTSVVYCELSASNCARFGYRPSDAEDLLLDAGFVFLRRQAARWSVIAGRMFETLGKDEQPATGYNLVAVRPAMLPTLAARFEDQGQTFVL